MDRGARDQQLEMTRDPVEVGLAKVADHDVDR